MRHFVPCIFEYFCFSQDVRIRRYVVVSDKDRENSDLDRELKDADIVISTPFHPAYITKARIEASPKLKMSVTAGIGSDHVDLNACLTHGLTVAEVLSPPFIVE